MNEPRLGVWPDTPPREHQLMAVIRSLAQHSELVIWTDHAFDRVAGRDSRSDVILNDKQALRILKTGDIKGTIRPGKEANEWIVKVVGPINHERGAREVGVVTAVLKAEQLIVMTIEWEDRR